MPTCPAWLQTLSEELLKVHRSYLKPIQALHEAKLLCGAAHITGGGLTDNVPRILPDNCAVRNRPSLMAAAAYFRCYWRKLGNIPEDDLRRTFNLGVGMVLVVRKGAFAGSLGDSQESYANPFTRSAGWSRSNRKSASPGLPTCEARVVLLSGRGSNFEAIAHNVLTGKLSCEIGFVFSNRPDAPGLARARRTRFPARLHPSAGRDRAEFDPQVAGLLKQHGVELVCLAGYMRLLTRRVRFAISRADPEYPSVAASGIPGSRCAVSGADAWRQGKRLHRSSGG